MKVFTVINTIVQNAGKSRLNLEYQYKNIPSKMYPKLIFIASKYNIIFSR